MPSEVSFSQLQLKFIDPIQHDYEVIRPIVLFSQPVVERSQETEIARTTVSDKGLITFFPGFLAVRE